MFKCTDKDCEKGYDNILSLSLHYRKIHKLPSKQLYVDYNCSGIEPTCKCGCGEEVKFLGIKAGFRDYRRGHKSRIVNPHTHRTKEAFEKLSKTRIQKFQDGQLSIWNKGLKKEDHESLVKQGKIFSENLTQEERDRRSSHLKDRWENNNWKDVMHQSGESHSQWKGGTSIINSRCHASRKLYNEWKYPILKDRTFTCNRCSSTKKLEVHHDQETMSEIIHKLVAEINPEKKDDWELQTKVVDAVVDYHIENKVSGEVICHPCHKLEHPSYNYKK